MSDAEDEDEGDSMLPTVFENQGFTSIAHMNFIGYVMAILIGLVLLPVLPILVLLWLLSRLRSAEGSPRYEAPTPE